MDRSTDHNLLLCISEMKLPVLKINSLIIDNATELLYKKNHARNENTELLARLVEHLYFNITKCSTHYLLYTCLEYHSVLVENTNHINCVCALTILLCDREYVLSKNLLLFCEYLFY